MAKYKVVVNYTNKVTIFDTKPIRSIYINSYNYYLANLTIVEEYTPTIAHKAYLLAIAEATKYYTNYYTRNNKVVKLKLMAKINNYFAE